MPWKVFKRGNQWKVFKLDADGEPTGDALGMHDTEAEAEAQQRALYASEAKKAVAVKMADGGEAEIEGLGMPFGGCFNGRDIEGEYFSKATDFAFDWFAERPLLYQHGLDQDAGISVVGRVKAWEAKADMGVWVKAQLDASSEYFGAIKELVAQGKLFFSSGSMRHLVRTDKSSGEIKRWPWVELSLTPTPANLLAELDFAAAEKHYAAAGIKVDLSALKAMAPAAMREMAQAMAKDMDVDMSGSDMDRMLGEMQGMEEEEARAHAKKQMERMADDAKKSAAVKAMVSYEDIRSEVAGICQARMRNNPFGQDCWCSVEATFADHCVVEVCSTDGKERYFSVPYTCSEDGHVSDIGMPQEVEETYVPKDQAASPAAMDSMSMATHADMAKAFVVGLAERTKGLRERRIKEGRVLSTGNRRKLGECLAGMRAACNEMQGLLDSTEPQPAKAASVRRRFDLLRLAVASIQD